jgi:FkbM family methyltransferase
LGPLARVGRRALVGRIEAELQAFHTKADYLLVALHQKNDATHRKLDTLVERLVTLEQRLEAQAQSSQLLLSKVDDVSLRVRSPIRIDETTFALRTLDGFAFVPNSDSLLLLLLLDAGPQGLEPGTRAVLIKLLAPGMTFVDVGAHIGLLTLAGARIVGPTGRVLAIEPTPSSFELLNRGILVNGMAEYVGTMRLAAGDGRRKDKFYVAPVLGHSSMLRLPDKATEEIEVDVAPLDELVAAGTRVDVVKIDVEGAELSVLKGMTRIVRDNQNLAIIAEYGRSHLEAAGISPPDWFQAFKSFGFAPFAIDEISTRCHPIDERRPPGAASINVLFARPNSRPHRLVTS